MVQPKGWRGLYVAVEIGGRPLNSFLDQDAVAQEGSADYYIEAVEGAEFSILFRIHQGFTWMQQNFIVQSKLTAICPCSIDLLN